MAATAKRKGPASVGALPSHVTENLAKGKAMNVTTNTTPARAAPVRMFHDLEEQVAGLTMIAKISADMLDRNLTDIRTLTGHGRKHGDNYQIILTEDQMRQLCFAWNDVVARAVKLVRDYFDILEGGES